MMTSNPRRTFAVLFSLLISLSETFVLDTTDSERSVVHQIFVSNGGIWGTWGPKQFCPNGTFANGYRLKIEPSQGDGDDTSVNGISLFCSGETGTGGTVTSTEGPWGVYQQSATCSGLNEYLVAFQMNVEPNQGFGDDTAINDIRFKCRGYNSGSTSVLDSRPPTPHYGPWGPFSAPCPANSAVCGLSTKVEGKQDAGFIHRDDTALNDVVFFCCDN